jgi:hypothetical protein
LQKEEEVMNIEAARDKPGTHQPRDFLRAGVLRLRLNHEDPGCSLHVGPISHWHIRFDDGRSPHSPNKDGMHRHYSGFGFVLQGAEIISLVTMWCG